jgi:DNA-binding GntR family transcriptional regulator
MEEKPHKSRVDLAYEELKKQILDNVLPPGFQATEVALAQRLNMSRTPVREALVRLDNEGLVEIVPRHGMRVLSVSAADMIEIYQIITSLETMAVQLLAERELSPEECTAMRSPVGKMVKAMGEDDLEAWAVGDEQFHESLLTLSGNKLLAQIAAKFRDQTHRARAITLRLRPKPEKSTEQHKRVVEEIIRGEPKSARNIHWNQRTRSYKELINVLEKFNITHF